MGRDTMSPDPFERFEAEHAEALRALARLEWAVDTLTRGLAIVARRLAQP
jgi:hypothetical protein